MDQQNNDAYPAAEVIELRRQLADIQQQLVDTQAENAYLREQHEGDTEEKTDNEERLNRVKGENAEFHELFERSRAQIAQLEKMAPAQLRQLIINLDVEGRHWHQQFHQSQEVYTNQIAQEQQRHAGEIELLQAVQVQHLNAVAAANVEIGRLRAAVHEHEREGRLRESAERLREVGRIVVEMIPLRESTERLREVGRTVAEMIRLRLASRNVQG
jgi:predicted nuclease with TOPRIM domain